MTRQIETDLPLGYRLALKGMGVNVIRPGAAGYQPFRPANGEGGLPVRVQVMTRVAGELQTTELFEKDFARARIERGLKHPEFGAGLRLSSLHRGLRLSQEVHWSTLRVEGREVLRLARRALVKIEQTLFTAPDHVRILALTRWGGLAKDESYELSTNMGWHHHRSMREKGQWGYFAWNTPYMFDADGPVSPHEGFMSSDVHCMGLAEYTVLSWPRERRAVMVAIDPVEYLERNLNLDWHLGPAEVGLSGWFEPTDVGAEYATPWQHYYFLDEEDDPLVTSTTIWREGYARRLNPFFQPEEELEPWFATEHLHGPPVEDKVLCPWDGDLTALEEHYAGLRRDPLDGQIHPWLLHSRPGFGILATDISYYYDFLHQQSPAGRVLLSVPLRHRVGDRATVMCAALLNKFDVDMALELRLTGRCFRFENAAVVPFKHGGGLADIPPEQLQVRQEGGVTRVLLEYSAAAFQKDFAKLPEYKPHLEVRFRVAGEIPADEGVLFAEFLYRQPGASEYQRHVLTSDAAVARGRFKFPPEPWPVRLQTGEGRRGYFYEKAPAYRAPNIFYEVKDGKPVRVPQAEFIPRIAALMRRYDVVITSYVASHGMSNYDFLRNPNWEIPKILALDAERKVRKAWYVDSNRSDMFCPACEEEKKMLAESLKRLLALGPFGIYYDEIHNNFGSCYSRDHGHGLCQDTRLAHRRGEFMRQVAREAGAPAMYMGTEVGGLLQHLYAQGHNFEGVDPSRQDEHFEEIKRLLLGQLCYGFHGSRAFFNYCFHGAQPGRESLCNWIYGHVLGLAFPRFSLATWSGVKSPIAYYFAPAVKKTFKEHYRYGATRFPKELALPGGPPLETLALTLESKAGLSVHFANLSGKEAVLSGEGYSVALGHGCALLADSFGNCLGQAQAVKLAGADYLALDHPMAFGLWRTAEDGIYLKLTELDQGALQQPARVFLSKTLLDRLAPGRELEWRALDKESAATPVEMQAEPAGVRIVYPADPACRCLRATQ